MATALATQAVIQEIYLHFQDSRSNKGYVSRILRNGEQYTHYTAWGGVGKSFQTGEKSGLTFEAATMSHDKVVREKTAKGYRACGPEFLGYRSESEVGIQTITAPTIEWVPMLFDPAERHELEALLADGYTFAQQKMDGERRRLKVEFGVVTGYNRRGLAVPVPGILTEAMRALATKADWPLDLDGEVIGNNQFHVFDVLNDPELRALSRVRQLAQLFEGFEHPGLFLVPTAETVPQKRALYQRALDEGWEGLIFKRHQGAYVPGRSSQDKKLKLWNTMTVLLVGVNATDRLQYGSMQMLCPTTRVPIGNVSGGFSQSKRATIGARLAAGEELLAEVRYLYFDLAALFQPTFRGLRDDVTTADLGDQPIYGREGRRIQLSR